MVTADTHPGGLAILLLAALGCCVLLGETGPPSPPAAAAHVAPESFCGQEAQSRPLHYRTLVVGDSITYDLVPALRPRGIAAEGVTCRQWDEGIAALATQRLPGRVVVELGSNGPVSWPEATAMMATLRPVRHVWFITVSAPVWWENSVNHVLASLQRYWGKVRLIDWHDAVARHPWYLGPDRVHPTPAGVAALATLITRATGG